MDESVPRISCPRSTIIFNRASESMSDERTLDMSVEAFERPSATVIVKAVMSWNAPVKGMAKSDCFASGEAPERRTSKQKRRVLVPEILVIHS